MPISNPIGNDLAPDSSEPRSSFKHAMLESVDAMMAALCKITPESRLETSITALLQCITNQWPDIYLGVLTLSPEKHNLFITSNSVTFLTVGESGERFFPGIAFERTILISNDQASVLHAASESRARLDDLHIPLARLAAAIGIVHQTLQLGQQSKSQSSHINELKSQLIQNQKLASIGQLAAGILHELNNPLTSIIAYSEYLHKKYQKGGGDPADIERLSRIEEAAKRILGLTRNLTDYARPSREERASISIRDIIERALVFCEHVFDQFGVTVNTSFEDVPAIRGAADQLMQVFVNLFTNAAHAMRDNGGHLSVSVAAPMPSKEITITIADDGHGVEPGHLDLIFKPFFTTKHDGTGTGLGLSIVQEIVSRHEGRIRVSSCANQGTVFTIDLPAVPRDNEG